MSYGNPEAGWYPDPHDQVATLRWWDGSAWTKHTAPAATPPVPRPSVAQSPAAQPPAAQPPAAQPDGGWGSASGPASGGGPGVPGGGWAGGGGWPGGGGGWAGGGRPWGRGSWPGPATQPAGGTFWQRNRLSVTAIGVVALYMALAVATGVVLLGIFPILLSARAAQRRETLAPLAVVAAVVSLVVGVAVLSHR